MANLIFKQLPDYINEILTHYDLKTNFKSSGSHFQGHLSDLAWIAIVDEKFQSTKKGYYPVFLFNGYLSGFYLALALGTTQFSEKVGGAKVIDGSLKEFSKRFNILTKSKVFDHEVNFDLKNFNDIIDLGGEEFNNGKDFEDSTIFSKYYDKNSLPSEKELIDDLLECIKIYEFTKELNIFDHVKKSFENGSTYETFLEDNNIDKNLVTDSDGKNTPGVNVILYGVPGSGKSWTIEHDYCNDESHMERVIFHPDYTYGDFVGQILPKVSEKDISYVFTPGPFTLIMKEAYKHEDENYFLIIEELNRGNAPAIFGDIFQLLDRLEDDKNGFKKGTSEYAVTNSDIATNIYTEEQYEKFGNKVRIPSNLSIIATMNTSDQNVFTLDNAFQRRWNMRMIDNTFKKEDKDFYSIKVLGTDVDWRKFFNIINDEILEKNKFTMSSEDKRLGVHFVNSEELKDNEKFSQKVIKYLWDDAFKFSRDEIFDSKYTSLEYIIRDIKDDTVTDKFSIFEESLRNKLNQKDETPSDSTPEEEQERADETPSEVKPEEEKADDNDSE